MKIKNFILSIFILSIISLNFSYGSEKKIEIKKASSANSISAPLNISDFYFLNEGWENGFNSWVPKDEADIGTKWNLTTWNAFEGTGQSWQTRDTSFGINGGYDNSWYQVLDTDPITLSGTGQQLTFYQRYSVEAPGDEPAGYNGWDGMNVRISSDNGASWDVLANPTPAYTSSSLYSFGFEHNEGLNIPGWSGSSPEWTLVTFDLSAYAGQTVMVRFAFASDPGYSTPDDSSLFGWEIDNILITSSNGTLFSNSGEPAGLTPKNNAAVTGNLWRIAVTDPFDSLSYASCNTDSNTYLPNMRNSLTSKYFLLSPLVSDIYFDFDLRGTFSDNNDFPDVDFFGVYIQVEGEASRRFISNIDDDPNGDNYVYSDAPPTWSLFSSAYSTGKINLKSLKGKKIRIIFEFISDSDTPVGSGLQIDDVVIYTPSTVFVNDDHKSDYPKEFKLEQNYPNPFNPITNIKYSVPLNVNSQNGATNNKLSEVHLKVYDVLGKEVANLVNEEKEPGTYEVKFDASAFPSGIYFYRISSGNFVKTKKMVLMK